MTDLLKLTTKTSKIAKQRLAQFIEFDHCGARQREIFCTHFNILKGNSLIKPQKKINRLMISANPRKLLNSFTQLKASVRTDNTSYV